MADRVWRNWAGNVEAVGFDALAPASAEEVVHAVTLAARTGRRVKPIGSGHSFTAIGQPVDLQLQLHRLTGVVAHDPETGRVRVRAGSRLRDLNRGCTRWGWRSPTSATTTGRPSRARSRPARTGRAPGSPVSPGSCAASRWCSPTGRWRGSTTTTSPSSCPR
ncbi:hypothetical protein GCM10025872_04610 [Barrientosiimonas endolithica]|uniref:FAD-binding PCMH-type domain-containing protein n=1 Tax=Barrientosiimonas endolithica TaxID=1535208 RepID=A0ABM8H7H4_9MICO|nr:hypothetical protein GCM10025872_04610 [Barrientosiimonas endolithica]